MKSHCDCNRVARLMGIAQNSLNEVIILFLHLIPDFPSLYCHREEYTNVFINRSPGSPYDILSHFKRVNPGRNCNVKKIS